MGYVKTIKRRRSMRSMKCLEVDNALLLNQSMDSTENPSVSTYISTTPGLTQEVSQVEKTLTLDDELDDIFNDSSIFNRESLFDVLENVRFRSTSDNLDDLYHELPIGKLLDH